MDHLLAHKQGWLHGYVVWSIPNLWCASAVTVHEVQTLARSSFSPVAEALGGTWFPSLGCLFPGGWVLLLRVHSCFLHRALPTPRHILPYSRSHKPMLSAETGIWQGVGSNWALSSPGGPTLCSSCSRERSLEDQDKVLFLPLPYPIFLSPQFMSTFSRIFPSVPI